MSKSKYQLYKDLASEFVGLLPDLRYVALKLCYKLPAALPQKRPCIFRGETGIGKKVAYATKGRPLSVRWL